MADKMQSCEQENVWRIMTLPSEYEARLRDLKSLHRSIIEQGRKVLNATSDKGMSQTEFIEWAIGELEEKDV